MKIKADKYIKYIGCKAILEECGNNLRAVKNHLKRNCHCSNISYTLKQFRQCLKDGINCSKEIKDEFAYIVKTYFGGLGLQTAVVLERLLVEYQHAHRLNLHHKNMFSINFDVMAYHVGLNSDEVEESIKKLQTMNLITVYNYRGIYVIQIIEDDIINFVRTAETDNDYKMWDYGLYLTQNQLFNKMAEEEEENNNS